MFPPATLLLIPVMLVLSGVADQIMRRFDLLPSGISKPVSICLLASLGMGGLYAGTTVVSAILRPASLQTQLIGKQYGSVTDLRRFEEIIFPDYFAEWTYELSPAERKELEQNCEPDPRAANCWIASHREADYVASASLKRDKLVLIEASF